MTDPADDDQGIPVGKRLVRSGGGAGLSLGERIAAQFYRLTWRTPLHALRLRGRYPLKLLAVPTDPVAGNVAAGTSLINGALTLEGETVGLTDQRADLSSASAAMVSHYHSFGWLRDLAAAGHRDAIAGRAEAMTRGWLDAFGGSVAEPAWSAGNTGRRLLAWPAYAPLILGSNDLVYRSAVLNAMARMARHADQVADRVPHGLDRVAAWCGVVAAGLLIAGGEARRVYGETGLDKALSAALSDDGGLTSRSPHEQLDLVGLLAQLQSIYDARQVALPPMLAEGLARTVPPLMGVTLGDGALSSWQGSLPAGAAKVSAILDASGVRSRALRQAREWGYQRLSAGATVVVFDAAPPPHARSTRHGCASTFAFEMSDGAQRLVVNCGGAAAAGVAGVSGLADGLRTSAAHSTLILADTNSTSVLANGTLGKGVDEIELNRQETEGGSKVEASHDGYVRRFGFAHRRSLALASDGRELRGDDTLIPAATRRKPVEAAFSARFHLAPGIDVAPTADGLGALLRLDEGPLWQFRCRGGTLSVEPSLWVDGDGKWQQTQQLVINGMTAAGGATIGWVFKRAG